MSLQPPFPPPRPYSYDSNAEQGGKSDADSAQQDVCPPRSNSFEYEVDYGDDDGPQEASHDIVLYNMALNKAPGCVAMFALTAAVVEEPCLGNTSISKVWNVAIWPMVNQPAGKKVTDLVPY